MLQIGSIIFMFGSEREVQMVKTRINENAFTYPMPVVVVGTLVEDRPNFMAVAWVTRVNSKPPMIGITLGKTHYTNGGIHATGAFSVNVPSIRLIEKVDYCGLVSGKNTDKSELFTVVRGQITGAPMIDECPICMECKVAQVVDLPANEIFIGEIVGAYADADCCTDGKPDIQNIRPFTLTMPDNRYWEVGANAGKAWDIGKNLRR
jgi:flavin reductase (DIM6/NTAB) family NADH-FMN oxidoreductase RutF